MSTQPASSSADESEARRAAVLQTSLVTGYNEGGGVHWIDVLAVDTGRRSSIAIDHSNFAVGDVVMVELFGRGRAHVREFTDDDLSVTDLLQCEGCPSLLDPRHCHYDVNLCAICDDCWAELLSVP